MSNSTLPKEQQSAYQRWEMNSFGDNRASTKAAENSAATNKLTIEQAALLREEARAKGRAEGHAEGLMQGRAAAAAELENLKKIAATFGDEVARADAIIAQDVLDLALDLSKAMMKTALTQRPELIFPIVSEAINYLPSLQQPAILFLHPDDAALVKSHMDDELSKSGWRVSEDRHLKRGGCRIETATNQIDATVETRWRRLTEALGKELDWLEP